MYKKKPEKHERGNPTAISVYALTNELEETDGKDPLLKDEIEDGYLRGKIEKRCLNNTINCSFST